MATSHPQRPPASRVRKVVCCSGHMIDRPDRPVARFPAGIEAEVRAAMASRLACWEIGPGDLAVSGGARGADILFAELCLDRGASVRLLVALPDEQYLDRSVRLPESLWETRYRRLLDRCEVWRWPVDEAAAQRGDAIGSTNRWILDTCRKEAEPGRFFTLLVWDELPVGDGAGGTADFALATGRYATDVAVVNPLRVGRGGASDDGPC